MSELEMRVDALLRLAVAEDHDEAEKAKSDIRNLMKPLKGSYPVEAAPADVEALVRRILTEMGTPDHLSGHPMLVQAIVLCVEDPLYINNITYGLYTHVAVMFDSTKNRVERAIRHAIEVTFSRCDIDVCEKYFGNTLSLEKGKATNSEFIARLANVVKMQLKNAAQ